MSNSLSLLLFTLVIILFSSHAIDDKVIKKVFQNFEEHLFQELDEFTSFPDKDSKAISLQHNLESEPVSRIRRSFPDNAGEQQAGEFSDKTHLDELSRDVLPDLPSDREAAKQPETNALVSDQIINVSSHADKMDMAQNAPLQKPLQSQNIIAGQQPGINLPVESHGNVLGQQQPLNPPLVKAESNAAVQGPNQSENNANVLQQPAQVPNNVNVLQQPAQVPNNINGLQQPAQVPNNVNGLQQPAQVPNNVNGLQQPAQVPNNVNGLQQPDQVPNNVNGLQQPAQVPNNINALQQPAQAQNDVNGLQQPIQVHNGIDEQKMHVKSNLMQQPSVQFQSNNGLARVSEQNSLNKLVLNPNGQSANDFNKVKNDLPTNQRGQSETDQQNYPVAKPVQGQQIIGTGDLISVETQNHLIDNGGLSVDQQKSPSINGNDEYVDQSVADKQHLPTKKPDTPSEFGMDNNLRPVHVSDNEINILPPEGNPQSIRPGQISGEPSKVSSSSKSPFFMISTIRNVQKESEHSQEFEKPDDGWYYNQEIDDSLHQGVTESEKHAGKQMLMSAHHFDNPLGALAGAKMFSNDVWQKNHKQYLMNKKSETFEPMSMALFYSWIALATLAVLGILTIFRHRHKVTGYVYDLRYWHNGGYVEEGRRLLHNAYA